MAGPCKGLVVLDFSWGMAGGLATAVLADFGSDVIKIEPPSGDPFRNHPAWIAWNRGKKSAVLDLKTVDGRRWRNVWWSRPTWCSSRFVPA
jgi:crotonobetainyl-CoA:carnitine CoA-transferase CaiB-like acyl-CoA transferase